MKQMDSCSVRPLEHSDRDRTWLWRNDPTVRAYMFSTSEIPWDQHVAWFERTLADPRKHALVFELQGQASGFACINEFPCGMVADWGFYKAPNAPEGTGTMLGAATLSYAFEVLRLHKIYAQVLGFNRRSIGLHLSLGFLQEGVLRDQFFDGHSYHDVCCFGIKSIEWTNSKSHRG